MEEIKTIMSVVENRPPSFLIHTLGCKVNQYDSESIRTKLLRKGYRSLSDGGESPDLIIVNTCSVTAESDRKGRQLIRKMIRRHPQARVVVTGCYATRKPEDLVQIDGIHEILPIEDQDAWVRRIAEELGWGCEDQDALWTPGEGIELFEEHTRAFVKIQDGCDLKCTFCSIPISRGAARSRLIPDVVRESHQLVERGYPEIVLCGICIGHYGKGQGFGLPELLREMVRIEGLKRVRISSMEPQDVTDALIDVLMEHGDVVCPHLHLPLQSGSNQVLRRMKRPYTRENFLELIDRARSRLPDFEVSTDIMTGFPGETELQFEETLEVVRIARFNKVHSFRFSARENTPALRLKDHLPPQEIEERRRRLDGMAHEVANEVKRSYINRTMEVLVEASDEQQSTGFTGNYLRVEFGTPEPIPQGKVLPVRITGLQNGRLQGSV
jgi:threonylcarbamoyladenosine tRNA methylthiotransferase MtaB